MTLPVRPYHQLVQEFLDWPVIRERLGQFPNLNKAYALRKLQRLTGQGPYYCHYMAWAVMDRPDLLPFWDCLLGRCSGIEGWQWDRVGDGKFEKLWSHIWEMQVAAAFLDLKVKDAVSEVAWLCSGPDLCLRLGGGTYFVEAYVYQKIYRAVLYLRMTLRRLVDTWIHVEGKPGFPVGMLDGANVKQDDRATALLIERVFQAVTGPWLGNARRQAEVEGRSEELHVPCISNLRVWLENPCGESRRVDTDNAQSTCEDAVERCVREALGNKAQKNHLAQNRPNVVVANFLPWDFTFGTDWLEGTGQPMPQVYATAPIDGIWCFAHGLDKPLVLAQGHRWHQVGSGKLDALVQAVQ